MTLNRFNPESYAFNYCAINNIKYDVNNIEEILNFREKTQKIKYNGETIKKV